MTTTFMEGFDVYAAIGDASTTGKWPVVNTTSINTTGGRYGGGALYCNNSSANMLMPASASEFWLGFGVKPTTTGGNARVLQINSTTGVEASLYYNTNTSVWTLYRGNAGTSLGTFTLNMASNSWHWVEVRLKVHASTGQFEVWVDDVQKSNLSGVNTAGSSGGNIYQIKFGSDDTLMRPYIDDIYFNDLAGSAPNNGRLGDSRIYTSVPTSDASPNNGTPSTGSTHYGVVDETPLNTTDYDTLTNTTGQEENFGTNAAFASTVTVYAVQVVSVQQKTDAAAASAKLGVKSSSTYAYGSTFSLLTTWSTRASDIFQVDPDTGVQWTYGGVNAAKINYTVV